MHSGKNAGLSGVIDTALTEMDGARPRHRLYNDTYTKRTKEARTFIALRTSFF